MTVPVRDGRELSYNGHEFDAMFKTKVSAKNVYDDAGRTVKYVQYTLIVTGYVTAGSVEGDSTDGELEDIRRALTQPGGKLRYEAAGFGTLTVNTGPDDRDCAWGPLPQALSFTPVGDWKAALIEWVVVFHLPEHATAQNTKRFSMLNVEQETTQDIDGYSTITTTVVAEIPVTRSSVTKRDIPDHVDRYKTELYKIVDRFPPVGFRRLPQTWRVSADGRRGTLTISYEQLPTPLPDGLSQADMEHEIGSSLEQGFRVWEGSINATFTAPAGTKDKRMLLNRFLQITTRVLGAALDDVVKHQAADPQGGTPTLLVTSFRMRNAVFGRAGSFSLTYRIMGATLKTILAATKIWSPLPGFSFRQWATSLSGTWLPRGPANVSFPSNLDAIVDLGSAKLPGILVSAKNGENQVLNPPSDLDASEGEDDITGSANWEYYENNLIVLDDQGIVVNRPLGPRVGNKVGVTATDALKDPRAISVPDAFGAPQPVHRNVHTAVAGPTYTVVMVGQARRVGKHIPIPGLVSVGGVPAVRKGGRQVHVADGMVGGYPRYRAAWRIEYALAVPPQTKLEALANPIYQMNGTKNDGRAS